MGADGVGGDRVRGIRLLHAQEPAEPVTALLTSRHASACRSNAALSQPVYRPVNCGFLQCAACCWTRAREAELGEFG